jgi:hypothetical protein
VYAPFGLKDHPVLLLARVDEERGVVAFPAERIRAGGDASPLGRTSARARPLLLICILLDRNTDGLGESADDDVTVTVIVMPVPLCRQRADEGAMANANRTGMVSATGRTWSIIV